jgi:uncharacterized membrane protein YraQ (UPF0718 family)
MNMSISEGSIWSRITSPKGFTAISQYFLMDWAAVWRDVAAGLLTAGALRRGCRRCSGRRSSSPAIRRSHRSGPRSLAHSSRSHRVCGYVPLAAVLWNSGFSFGGVIACIYAHLIVLPILDNYRRSYTARVAWVPAWTPFVSMAVAGLVVEGTVQGDRTDTAAAGCDRCGRAYFVQLRDRTHVIFLMLAGVLV